MAGYKENFGGNVDFAGRGVNDMAGRLERGVSSAASTADNGAKQVKQLASSFKDAGAELQDFIDKQNKVAQGSKAWADLQNKIDGTRKRIQGLKKDMAQMPFDALEKTLGRATKSLLAFNTGLIGIGFDFVIDSIKRVYDLQEKWTKAIGGFNMKIGGATKGLKGMTKTAVALSGQLRGLTNGDISEAIDGFGEFNDALGSTTDAAIKFGKTSLQLSRGFNLGWAGAGKLTKAFNAMDDGVGDVDDTMNALVKASNASGVSVNMVAKDIADASSYMTRFGKEGQKMFVEGAAYARKYGISITEVQKAVEGFDTFDDAAKVASKLNTAFGTMINSMDLMMEDDPAKRLEMIRQQFLAQGETFDKLTPKQRRYLSETLKLTEEQTAALMGSQNATEDYAKMQAKAAEKEAGELKAKEMMQKVLASTAQTMFAFGVAFDKVTLAIGRAIKPFLVVLGLAKDSKKGFEGFGSVMQNITNTVVAFFDSLAGNDKWMAFMKTLADDLVKAGSALKEFVMSGKAADLVGELADNMKSFYTWVRDAGLMAARVISPLLPIFLKLSQHLGAVAIAWGAVKGFNMLGGANGLAGKAVGGGLKLLGSGGGKAMAGMAVGGAAGQLMGGTGATAGGLIGGLVGPLGGLVGAAVGKVIDKLWHRYDEMSAAEVARSELDAAIKREADAHESNAKTIDSLQQQQKLQQNERTAWAAKLADIDSAAHTSKTGEIELTDEDVASLRDRATELMAFSKNTMATTEALGEIFKPGGATSVSVAALDTLREAAAEAATKMKSLSDQADELEKSHEAELLRSKGGLALAAGNVTLGLDDARAKRERAKLEGMGGGVGLGFFSGHSGGAYKGTSSQDIMRLGMEGKGPWSQMTKEEQARIRQAAIVEGLELKVVDDKKKLVNLQFDNEDELKRLQLRQILMQRADEQAFSQTAGEQGASPDQVLDDWLRDSQNKASIINDYGSTLYDSVSSRANGPRMTSTVSPSTFDGGTSNSVFSQPTPTNFASPVSTPASTNAPQQQSWGVYLDRDLVGKALMK